MKKKALLVQQQDAIDLGCLASRFQGFKVWVPGFRDYKNEKKNSLKGLTMIILKLQSCSYQREFAQLKGCKFKIFLGMCSRKHLIMAFNAVGFDRLCG